MNANRAHQQGIEPSEVRIHSHARRHRGKWLVEARGRVLFADASLMVALDWLALLSRLSQR